MNAPPEFTGVLARALLKAPNHKLPLLPAGEATIEEAGKLDLDVRQGRIYAIPHHRPRLFAAIDLARSRRCYAASISSWFSVVSAGLESASRNC